MPASSTGLASSASRRAVTPLTAGGPRARRGRRPADRARLAGGPSRLRAHLRGRQELPAGLMAAPRLGAARLTGLKVGPTLVTVDARWLMAYAAALGETDPRYYDTRAHGGPLAHPLFSVCYEWPLALALRAKAMDEAIARRGVHAFHNLVVHRPPQAGESL